MRFNGRTCCLLLLFLFRWISPSYADVSLAGQILVATTPELTLRMQGTGLESLVNRVTGETYIAGPGPGWCDLIMQNPPDSLLRPGPWHIETDQATGQQVGVVTTSDAFRKITLTIGADAASGEISIRISGSSAQPGVRNVLWGIQGFKPIGGRFLLPAQAGIYFDANSPSPRTGFEYPTHWEAQFAVYETSAGGLLLYARDTRPYFKRVQLSREFGTLDLAVETFALAPWSQATEVPSLEWRFKAFGGSWRVAVDYYRAWSDQVMKVQPRPQPEWMKQIQVVTRVTSPVLEYLDAVAAHLDPTKTLIYLINWRKDPFDVNYPDYTPDERTPAFLQRARQLGFRIMLHTNALGVATYNALYDPLSKFQIRNPDTGDRVFWPFGLWPGGVPPPDYLPVYAFISPAALAYRQAWIEALRPALDQLKPDALHVDAGGVMLNDANGLIEDKTTIEGMVELNRLLLEAYPGLALSFESMTEFLSPLFALAQRWPSDFPAHPIGTYFFRDRTNWYGFLDQENPDEAGFIRYIRRYEYQGVLPTIEIDSLVRDKDVEHPISEIIFKVLRLWQHYNFRPDWDADWQGLEFRFISEDGQTTAAFADSGDVVRFRVGDEVIYERSRDSTFVETGSFIRNWLAFDQSSVAGLDPAQEYWLEPGLPRPNDVPHLSNLPKNVKLGLGTKATRDYGYFELDRIPPATFDFIRGFSSARIGVIYNGKEYALTHNGTVQLSQTLVGGTLKSPVLIMSPPVGYPGAVVFAEYQVPVPDGQSYLNFSAAISDLATRSDGILFVVRIGGTEVFRQTVHRGEVVPMNVNLMPWAGRSTDVRFIVHPGARLNPVEDWGVWSDLSISVEESGRDSEFDVGIQPGSATPSIDGTANWTTSESPAILHTTSPLPAKFVVFTHPPQPIELNGSLLDLPFDVWRVPYGGMGFLNKVEASGTTRSITSAGEREPRALATYPPNKGLTVVSWAVRLPENAAALAFRVGLSDPPPPLSAVNYSGAEVTVRLNGERVFTRTLRLAGWNEAVADITHWAGQNVVVELEVDPDSNATYDWVYWADLRIR